MLLWLMEPIILSRLIFYAGSKISDKAWVKLAGFITNSDGYNAVPDSLKTDPDYTVPRFLEEYALSAKAGYAVLSH